MKTREEAVPSLTQIEGEVMAEGRAWTWSRMEERLQQLAEGQGEVFQPKPKAADAPARATVSSGHRRGRR